MRETLPRARRLLVGLALTLLAGGAQTLAAQSVAEYERRLDSLTKRVAVLNVARAVYSDSVMREYKKLDSVQVRGVLVTTPKATVGVARWALTAALDSVARQFGPMDDVVARVAAGHTLVLRRGTYSDLGAPGEGWESEGPVHYQLAEKSPLGDRFESTVNADDSLALARKIQQRIVGLVMGEATGDITKWLANWTPGASTPGAWAMRRVNLVSERTVGARRCFEGDVAMCKAALGLTPASAAATEVRDADSRRDLVFQNRWRLGDDLVAVNRCVNGRDDECVALLARHELKGELLSSDLRASLAEQAVIMGGPGALARLVAPGGTASERLAAAAGVPIDSVVSAWLTHLVTAQLPSDTANPTIAITAAGWTLLLAGLALRSSRWR